MNSFLSITTKVLYYHGKTILGDINISLIFVLLALVVIEELTVLSAWIPLFCQVDNLVYML